MFFVRRKCLLSWLSYADVHASSTLLLNIMRSTTPIHQQSLNGVILLRNQRMLGCLSL